jgi:hypothetical protein
MDYQSLTALLVEAGWTRVGHDFVQRVAGPCDCPPSTPWDPHWTCLQCGAYGSHSIHGVEARTWRAPFPSDEQVER